MPVFQFDAQDSRPGLVNYWGYAPVSFFAPHHAYSSRQDSLGPLDEFRDMVKALHRAGIEVILDVVFNHTAEGDHNGPTLSLRGLDNSTYYILDKNHSRYADYSGTGNTLTANHPIVRRMIVDSLRYWVEEKANDNRNWNCGVEGPTDDPAVEKLRNRQVKNFLAITMLSAGVPMFLMGDEAQRTQRGNNNAYCQDNETSWFDWTLIAKHADVHRFVTQLNARRVFRQLEPEGQRVCLNHLLRGANLAWHGVRLGQPDWSESSHSIAFTLEIRREKTLFHMILNAYWEALDFELPRVDKTSENPWRRWIDTALDSPRDIVPWEKAESVLGYSYRAEARSVVMLFARA